MMKLVGGLDKIVLVTGVCLTFILQTAAFSPKFHTIIPGQQQQHHHHHVGITTKNTRMVAHSLFDTVLYASDDDDDDDDDGTNASEMSGSGDKLRASTGIRPSLHPVTINAISQALLLRCTKDAETPMEVIEGEVEPLEVAIAAGKLAAVALKKRATSCQADGDEDSIPTEQECQTVAGRVVGVVMRFRDLEKQLAETVQKASWVLKYHEEASFGLLRTELQKDETTSHEDQLVTKIRNDPLFRMCRAECLLAIFLQTIELPSLEKSGVSVPGGSNIDFIDQDRIEVLLPELQ